MQAKLLPLAGLWYNASQTATYRNLLRLRLVIASSSGQTSMDAAILIELPATALSQIQATAREQTRSVPEVVRDLVLQALPGLPALPPDAEAELAAFEHLSGDVLRLLSQSTLPDDQQRELAALNDKAQRENLSTAEQARQQVLVDAYDRLLVRRAQATALLHAREKALPI
jgi:hypothetical protein